jgi:hypothetical protein
MRLRTPHLFLILAVVVAGAAEAQFVQYSPPGTGAIRELPTRERIDAALEDARWNFGPVRVTPWFGVRDVTYYDDVFPEQPGKQSDFSISAGVGLSAFLPVGPKLMLVGSALPEYQWWQKLDNRRTWNGRYALGLAGYFNRLNVEVAGARVEEPQHPSYEIEVPVNTTRDRAFANVEVEVIRRIFVYASASENRWRYRFKDFAGQESSTIVLLDRDETRFAGGVRYAFRRWLSLRAGAERVEVDFTRPEANRSNRGTAPAIGIDLDTGRFGADVSIARYSIDPVEGSEFVPFEGSTGRARLSWSFSDRVQASLYGSRNLGFSARAGSAYSTDDKVGAALNFPLGWRAAMTVFGEVGKADYRGGGFSEREDDITSYGARSSVILTRTIRLQIGASETEYDSNFEQLDRTWRRVEVALVFGTAAPVVW